MNFIKTSLSTISGFISCPFVFNRTCTIESIIKFRTERRKSSINPINQFARLFIVFFLQSTLLFKTGNSITNMTGQCIIINLKNRESVRSMTIFHNTHFSHFFLHIRQSRKFFLFRISFSISALNRFNESNRFSSKAINFFCSRVKMINKTLCSSSKFLSFFFIEFLTFKFSVITLLTFSKSIVDRSMPSGNIFIGKYSVRIVCNSHSFFLFPKIVKICFLFIISGSNGSVICIKFRFVIFNTFKRIWENST
mmetsp:Transcript_25209/g.38692  ORF Transcript_25209/g.38692 Transcript_25209/m.38692 type:complete len:252 (+) Transcript_25209:2353-3108(+)